ncbi:MAG TPA: hypothetical protein VFZ03_05495 [Dongiaceae bacterium]
MKSIQVDGDVYSFLTVNGMGTGESASAVLRRALFHTIDIDDDLYAYLMSLAVTADETAPSILRRALNIQDHATGSVTPAASRIDFHIPAGTGSGPWNAREQAIAGVVGQTLRIFNNDSVAHRPHTNGVPFQHAASGITPGTFADFVLDDPVGLDTPSVYDHNFGAAARFWISVRAAA